MTRLASILICVSLAACGAAAAPETQAVDPGAEITLAPGASVSVKTAEMTVRFVAITEDSRCPRDTTCVWAGEVKAQLEIRQGSQTTPVEVLEGDSAVAGGYRVTLVRVEPYPASPARIAPQDYRATVKIDKAR